MKKVLLLGDSIRMGYDDYVKEMLEGKCEVFFLEDNGRFSSYTLWQMNRCFNIYGSFDVVHWNNGYWDMDIEKPMETAFHPINEYIYFLKRIINECRKNGAKVIFATTTPVLDVGKAMDNTGTGASISFQNDWVQKYNEAAKKLMAEENVMINDLYELCLKDKNYYKSEDMIHLTDEGYKMCAKQVVECILKVL